MLSRWEFRPFRVERTEAQHFTDSSPRQRVWHFHVPCLLELRAKIRAIGKWRNANEMGGPAETGGQIARASQAKFAAELLDERTPSKGSPSRDRGRTADAPQRESQEKEPAVYTTCCHIARRIKRPVLDVLAAQSFQWRLWLGQPKRLRNA